MRPEGIYNCNLRASTDCDSTSTSITVVSSLCICGLDLSQLDLASFSDTRVVKGVLRLRFKTKSSVDVTPPSDFLEDFDCSPASELALACAFCGLELTKEGDG